MVFLQQLDEKDGNFAKLDAVIGRVNQRALTLLDSTWQFSTKSSACRAGYDAKNVRKSL